LAAEVEVVMRQVGYAKRQLVGVLRVYG